MVLGFVIGNLNTAYIYMVEDEELRSGVEFAGGHEESASPGTGIRLPDYTGYIFGATIIGIFIISYFFAPKEERNEVITGTLVRRILPGILLLLFIYNLDRIGVFIESSIGSLPSFDIPSLSDVSLGNGGGGTLPSGFEGAGIISLILLSILTTVILFIIYRNRTSTDKGDKEKEDITTTADRAIRELHQGKNVNDVIIRNYQKMCIILEKEGISQKTSFTPRELERKAIKKLSLKKDTIDQMTRLFEKAKYSDHPLGKEERDEAIKNFKRIKTELEAK